MFSGTAFNTPAAEAVPFYVEPESTHTGAVGSTLDGSKNLATLQGTRWHHHRNAPVGSRYAPAMVRAVDAGAFLGELARSTDFVAAKFDVEGFEYTLLPHLIRHSADALCALQVLAIEWHDALMPKHHGETGTLSWFMRHAVCNITVLHWT